MSAPKPVPRRPYLLRAMFDWIIDSQYAPHVIVDAQVEGVRVPLHFIKDGKIVLNLSPSATQGLKLGNEVLEFNARFTGIVHHVRIPLQAVLGIYARETGEGMVFSESDWVPEPPSTPDTKPPDDKDSRRARFKVVK